MLPFPGCRIDPGRCYLTDFQLYRISDAENQIGGGLIEEVIQVAEGELKLVDCMAESKVYVLSPLDKDQEPKSTEREY